MCFAHDGYWRYSSWRINFRWQKSTQLKHLTSPAIPTAGLPSYLALIAARSASTSRYLKTRQTRPLGWSRTHRGRSDSRHAKHARSFAEQCRGHPVLSAAAARPACADADAAKERRGRSHRCFQAIGKSQKDTELHTARKNDQLFEPVLILTAVRCGPHKAQPISHLRHCSATYSGENGPNVNFLRHPSGCFRNQLVKLWHMCV